MPALYRLAVIAALFFGPVPASYGQSMCGNDDREGQDSGCDPEVCEDCPGSNPFDPYTGNMHREVQDLQVWGGAGEIPLVWKRYYNSRAQNSIGWSFSWQYEMYDRGTNTKGHAQIEIVYPEGGRHAFTQNVLNPNRWLPEPGVGKRVFQEGNSFFLQLDNGHRYRFEKLTDAQGNRYYQLQDMRDSQQNLYQLTYNRRRQLARITEPAGRYLAIEYTTINGIQVISKATTSDGRNVFYDWRLNEDGRINQLYLKHAYYGDGTKAFYEYLPSGHGGLLNLAHAVDPRYDGAAVDMRYLYNEGVAEGFIMEERNGKTNALMACLQPGIPNRTVCYPNGRVVVYDRRSKLRGQLQKYTDGAGASTSYAYDHSSGGTGYVKAIRNALDQETVFNGRTGYGNPLEIKHPDGSTEHWTRDNLDLVTSHTDGKGRTTAYARDGKHRITRIDYPDGQNEQFTYNEYGQVLTRTRRNGAIESFQYDGRGLRKSFTDAKGNVTRYTYDNADRLATVTDARGNTTQIKYNERGLVTRETNADNTFRQYGYDGFGNRTRITNELGHTWTTDYDEFRRPVTRTDPLNRVTRYAYDLPGGVCGCSHNSPTPTRITLPSGRITEIEYDVEWRKIRETVAAGTDEEASTFYEYDPLGNLKTVIDPEGNQQEYAYDAQNRRTGATDALGQLTEWGYDAVGNVTSIRRPDGGTTIHTYDAMNRLSTTTDPKGQVTTIKYDAEGNRKELIDANGQSYVFAYDPLNRPTRMTYPDGSFEESTYDPVGNLATHSTRSGAVRTYQYDNRNRETSSDWSDATPDVVSSYDAAGRLETRSSRVSKLAYAYNAANELSGETQTLAGAGGAKTVRYEINADGLRHQLYYPEGNAVEYEYSQRNQLASVIGSGIASYSYDVNGNRSRKGLPNGTRTDYAYNDEHRPVGIHHLQGDVSFALYEYGYDNLNRRTFVIRDGDRGDVYAYDATSQVTEVQYEVTDPAGNPGDPGKTVTYDWDAAGNRTTVTDNGSPTLYTPNALNQYTHVGGLALPYDANGNLKTLDGWTYTYDAQSRLTKATNGSTTVAFAYDPRNRCVQQTFGGKTTFFYYDNWNLVEERTAQDELLAQYVHGAGVDELLWKASAEGTVYYHHDALGNVTHLTNAAGEVVEKYAYDVFGEPAIADSSGNQLTGSAYGNRFLFTGREYRQEIGLYDYRNRVYSSSLGRFLQVDPIGFDAGDNNLYRYALNNSVNITDPFGLEDNEPSLGNFADQLKLDLPPYPSSTPPPPPSVPPPSAPPPSAPTSSSSAPKDSGPSYEFGAKVYAKGSITDTQKQDSQSTQERKCEVGAEVNFTIKW